jgi:hypothetical protein
MTSDCFRTACIVKDYSHGGLHWDPFSAASREFAGTNGSAMSIALRQGKVKVRLLSPPSPVTPNHLVAVVVNPDASRSFAGCASDGPVPHGPGARGGSSGSADRRRAGRNIGPPAHSRRHNRSDRGRSS